LYEYCIALNLKNMNKSKNMNIVGVPTPQLDTVSKVTGRAEYCGDIYIRGALYGAILRSPHAHARIVHVDPTRAEKLKGVAAVLTSADTAGKKFGRRIKDEDLLAIDKVRHVGEEVAVVAADDRDIAQRALDLIDVVYEDIPAVLAPSEALAPGAPIIHDAFPENIAAKYIIERGDSAAGFGKSKCGVAETFSVPRVNPGYLEPTTCLVSIDENEKLTVWAPSSSPFRLRDTIAYVLDLPASKIRVIKPTVGGSFGSRHIPKNALLAALISWHTKRPVRIEASRFDEFTMARPRMAAEIKLKMGFAKDGAILAKQTEIVADNGAYTDVSCFALETMAQRVDCLYRLANLYTRVTLAYTNLVPTGAFRGFGNPQMHFALESMLDMAAQKLAIDPLVLRRKNAARMGDITVHGWKLSSCALSECIDKARQESDWDSKRSSWSTGRSTSPGAPGQKSRGIGIACMIHVAGRRTKTGFWGSTAWVQVLTTGKVVVISGDADVGQGCNTVFVKIAAEELGLPLEVVEIAPLDTDNCPYALGSYSDRVTILGGEAVRLAAVDVRQQIIQLAAEYFCAPAGQVTYKRGLLYVKGSSRKPDSEQDQTSPENTIHIFDLMRHFEAQRGAQPLLGVGTYAPEGVVFRDKKSRYGNKAAAYTFAAQVAEVEVDLDTGQVKLLDFTCAHDLGRAINPPAAEGQVEGALAQGIGYALTEEVAFIEGHIANPSFLEYKLPTACETLIPKVILVESNEPHGPFGAKGVAEPGLVPTAAAIANAISHAAGIRITSLPITPQKVLAALETQRKEVGKTR
jgi:CO/xanthine dehydrogenase Mo-binding subunit